MLTCDIDGQKISYWMGRRRPVEGSEKLLFIHGAGGGQFTWIYQEVFFEKRFNPIIVESKVQHWKSFPMRVIW